MLSPIEHSVLKKLIALGRLELGQVEELVQMLDLHRVKDASATITDLIIARHLATPAEINKLLADVEQESAPAPKPHHAPQPVPRPRPAPARPAPPPKSSSTLIYAAIAFWVVLVAAGAGFWFVYKKKQPVQKPDAVASRAESSAKESVEPVALPPSDRARMEADLAKALEVPHPRRRLEDLGFLIPKYPDFRQEVARKLGEERERVDRLAEVELRNAAEKVKKHRDAGAMGSALAIYDELLERYGVDAVNGRIKKARDDFVAGKVAAASGDAAPGAVEDAMGRALGKGGSAGSRHGLSPPPADSTEVAGSGGGSAKPDAGKTAPPAEE